MVYKQQPSSTCHHMHNLVAYDDDSQSDSEADVASTSKVVTKGIVSNVRVSSPALCAIVSLFVGCISVWDRINH